MGTGFRVVVFRKRSFLAASSCRMALASGLLAMDWIEMVSEGPRRVEERWIHLEVQTATALLDGWN